MIDRGARFYNNFDEFKLRVAKYIKAENKELNEISLLYLDKWIWINPYTKSYGIYLDINFSHDFARDEIDIFLEELEALGVVLPENDMIDFFDDDPDDE